jgi:hypothetical protein
MGCRKQTASPILSLQVQTVNRGGLLEVRSYVNGRNTGLVHLTGTLLHEGS